MILDSLLILGSKEIEISSLPRRILIEIGDGSELLGFGG